MYDEEAAVRSKRAGLSRSSRNKAKRAELEAEARSKATAGGQLQREALELMLTRIGDLGAAVQLVLRAPSGRRMALWRALVERCDGNGRPSPLDLLEAATAPVRVSGWEPPLAALAQAVRASAATADARTGSGWLGAVVPPDELASSTAALAGLGAARTPGGLLQLLQDEAKKKAGTSH